jgi:LysM repeat protein
MSKVLVALPIRLKAGIALLLAFLMLTVNLFLPAATPLFAQSGGDQPATGFMVDINQNATTTYIVQRGDTLGGIARRHNTDVSTLLRLNPQITDPNRITAGQRILVPVPSGPGQPGRPPSQPPSRPPTQPPTQPVIALAYIHMIALGSNGPLGCGDRVAPVLQEFPATQAILRAALERQLGINTQFYRDSGLYNALYLSSLTIGDVRIVNGLATINLSGRVVMSGTCDGPRIRAQLEETALQFSTVNRVEIFVNGHTLQSVTQ